MTYCLDTNICIYFLTGRYPALYDILMSSSPKDIKIPSIVKAELLHGAEKSAKPDETKEKLKPFLFPFEIVPFGDDAAQQYAVHKARLEKAGMFIGSNDLIIAATALSIQAVLVTNNEREFSRIDGLSLENWTLPASPAR
ncbi:MAG: type II toxin-antitoxin system VapC family toxin [Clostridiales bacterium]|nr:type II toxin-antitoxin system VapC family toxin [Clostridiales bacterium]